MQEAVERVIKTMWDRYHEPLTLTELADVAILSRFYVSRVFRLITGTSPGRFLTAIRLFEAKKLLLATSLSVTDISYQVGYNSLGTFTSRFTQSVGVSPGRFRFVSQAGMPRTTVPLPRRPDGATVFGTLNLPDIGVPLRVYVGLFESPIAQGNPAACDILDEANSYRMHDVPGNEWCIRAVVVATRDLDPRPWERKPLLVNKCQFVRLSPGSSSQVDLDLRPVRLTDLPILVALPELDGQGLDSLILST
jgi:AraC-like DNA-binding protein